MTKAWDDNKFEKKYTNDMKKMRYFDFCFPCIVKENSFLDFRMENFATGKVLGLGNVSIYLSVNQ